MTLRRLCGTISIHTKERRSTDMKNEKTKAFIQGVFLSMLIVGGVYLLLPRINTIPVIGGVGVYLIFGVVLCIGLSTMFYYRDENFILNSTFRRLRVPHEVSKRDLTSLYPYNLIYDIHKVNSFGRMSDEELLYRVYVPGVFDVVEGKLSMQERDIVRLKYRYFMSDSKISEMRSISKNEIHTILKNSFYKIRNGSSVYLSESYREKEAMKNKLEESERKLRVLLMEKGTKNLRIYTDKFPISMLKLSDYVKDRLVSSGIQYVEDMGNMSVDELVNLTHLGTNDVVSIAYQLNRLGIRLSDSREMLQDSSDTSNPSKIVSL